MRASALPLLTILFAASLLPACGATRPTPRVAAEPPGGSPLGPSYVLLPLPSEDDSLLGRIVPSLPEPGRSLEEVARPNPCADKLAAVRKTPLTSTFEDVQELSIGARARATLGMFGFDGDVSQATHFVYRLETTERVALADTNEYVACCKENECGYGYVSALVYGHGEYATGSDEQASGGVDTALAGASGNMHLKILHKRSIGGYLAALVTITTPGEQAKLGPLGAMTGLAEDSLSDQVKQRYEPEKIRLEFGRNASGEQVYELYDGRGPITENEMVRRYRELTGSDDLDDVESRRNLASVIFMGAFTGVSTGFLIWGITNLETPCTRTDDQYTSGCDHTDVSVGEEPPTGYRPLTGSLYYDPNGTSTNTGAVVATSIAGPMTFVFGLGFLGTLLSGDGVPTDHALTDRELYPHVQRYNRALLRKTIRDVEHTSGAALTTSSVTVEPTWGMSFVGLRGRF